MASEAHLAGLSENERDDLLERAAMETRTPAALGRVHVARGNRRRGLPVEVTAEMVAVAAIAEAGRHVRQDVSTPGPGAILGRSPGPLAQLGERRLDKPEVTGSSPVRP